MEKGEFMIPARRIINLIIVLLIVLLLFNLLTKSAEAPDAKGPYEIAGRVYDSDGENLPDGFERTYAAVIIEHEGEKKTFIDYNGIEQDDEGAYWYVVLIPDGNWDFDDPYWIRINGTGWGDLNFTCRAHDNPDKFKWSITELGAVYNDVNTVDSKFNWEGEDEFPVVLVVGLGIVVVIIVIILYVLRYYGYY